MSQILNSNPGIWFNVKAAHTPVLAANPFQFFSSLWEFKNHHFLCRILSCANTVLVFKHLTRPLTWATLGEVWATLAILFWSFSEQGYLGYK